MKVSVTAPGKDLRAPDTRQAIAVLASALITANYGDPRETFVPLKSNQGDSSVWTVDHGNDWKIMFHGYDEKCFEVWHRYQINDRARKLEYSKVNERVKDLATMLAKNLIGVMSVDMDQ